MAWGMNFDPGTNLVDVYVGYLRRKLGEAAIKTVRGAGYCLQVDSPGGITE
jgi:DNA-binding response OmpR family regulator